MTFRGTGEWGVSTLGLNPVTGEPVVTLFTEVADAIGYARVRALRTGVLYERGARGPGDTAIPTERGRTYYVLRYTPGQHDTRGLPVGIEKFRVLRGGRGERRQRGQSHPYSDTQEQVMVFDFGGVLPNGKTRWKLNKGLTVNVPNLEEEIETAKRKRGPQKLTLWDRRGDPQ